MASSQLKRRCENRWSQRDFKKQQCIQIEMVLSPAERKIPASVPCLNRSSSITWWKWAGRALRLRNPHRFTSTNPDRRSPNSPTPKNSGQVKMAVAGPAQGTSMGSMQARNTSSSVSGATTWFLSQRMSLTHRDQKQGSAGTAGIWRRATLGETPDPRMEGETHQGPLWPHLWRSRDSQWPAAWGGPERGPTTYNQNLVWIQFWLAAQLKVSANSPDPEMTIFYRQRRELNFCCCFMKNNLKGKTEFTTKGFWCLESKTFYNLLEHIPNQGY